MKKHPFIRPSLTSWSLTPESWNSVALDLSYSVSEGIERYSHVISSLDGHKEPVVPSDELHAATHNLGRLFERHGKHWRAARYEMRLQGDGSWKYVVRFDY
jgi:hypothetical protein